MTTAARPTFNPAQGGRGRGEGGEGDLSALSKQYSSRDLPGHTKLKYRQTGQNTSAELRGQDFRRELETRERGSTKDRGVRGADVALAASTSHQPPSKRPRLADTGNLDADDKDDDDTDDSDSDESDDDATELLAELQKIKRERAAEAARKEEQKRVEDERIRTETILSGNPLLNLQGGGNMKVKRRWDDDVVFKNCAKDDGKNKDGTFINDTLRSEFHKKFMSKYVQ
ncbi:protein CWC15 homolog [Sycon ciliatum]|uniref:protein CWC15 homolog n=1 Tax=Sycon ciliatum TaxID=27933 RepID=UPI0020A8A656|eukprot:scpid99154/ scgid22216/ Protein CWC15 homolog